MEGPNLKPKGKKGRPENMPEKNHTRTADLTEIDGFAKETIPKLKLKIKIEDEDQEDKFSVPSGPSSACCTPSGTPPGTQIDMLKEPKALLEKLPTLEEAELLAEKVQEAYNKLRKFKMVMKIKAEEEPKSKMELNKMLDSVDLDDDNDEELDLVR